MMSLTFGLFTQVSGSGPLGPLVLKNTPYLELWSSYCTARQCWLNKTNFGLVLYNLTNFYWFEETSSYWSVKRVLVFLCFPLLN